MYPSFKYDCSIYNINNKPQWQSQSNLEYPRFSHGQIFIAISRVGISTILIEAPKTDLCIKVLEK